MNKKNKLLRAQKSLEMKRLKELRLRAVLRDYKQDIATQHAQVPTPVTYKIMDCLNFLLGEI